MEKEFVKTTILRWLDALNNKEADQLDQLTDELYTVDLIQHTPGIPSIKQGIAGQKEFQMESLRIFSDGHLTLDEILWDGDRLITRWSFKGTNSTTGNEEQMSFIEINRVVRGKIAEVWSAANPGSW